MGGGQTSTPSTTTQNTQPWSAAQPALQNILGQATNLYSNYTPQYYGGNALSSQYASTVAALSPDTQGAINAEYNYGSNGGTSSVQNSNSYVNSILNGAGYANNPGNSIYSGVANSSNPATAGATAAAANQPGSQTLSGIASGQIGSANPGYGSLGSFADGQQGTNNPYLQQTAQAAAQQVSNNYLNNVVPGVASSAEAAGRYGSGAQLGQQNIANLNYSQGLAQAVAPIYNQDYLTGQANQLQAASTLGSLYQGQTAQQANAANSLFANNNQALSTLGTIGQYNTSNQLAGAGGLSSNYNTALGNQTQAAYLSPSLQSANYQNIAAMGDAGNQLDAYNQAQLTGATQAYNYGQQLPYQMLSNYAGYVDPIAGMGGSSTSTQPYYSSGNSGLSSVLQIAGIAAMFL